jgi:hypothetical protein
VIIDYGKRSFKFYPINQWPERLGVTNPTLREWIRRHMLVPTKKHGMYLLSMAELHAVRRVIDKIGGVSKAHITPEFAAEVRQAQASVLLAFDYFKRTCAVPLPEHLRQLILPSLTDM